MAKPPPSSGKKKAPVLASPGDGKRLTLGNFLDGIHHDSEAGAIMAAAAGQGVNALDNLRCLLGHSHTLPDFAGPSGVTPLMVAAACGNASAIEVLASHPLVDLSRQDKGGRTALHYAASYGHADCLRVLLSHGAPLNLPDADGKLPFDLVIEEKAVNAFWESRDFARYMKQQQPEHPKFQPAPSPVAETAFAPPAASALEPPAEKLAEIDPLKEAFFRGVAGIGLHALKKEAHEKLISSMAKMPEQELKKTFKTIRDTNAPFEWSKVFIEAAGIGNIPAMRFLHNEILFDQRTLDVALSAVIMAGDDRNAAHHLVIWGANPDAHFEVNGQFASYSIRSSAFSLGQSGCFEEMVTWARELVPKRDIAQYRDALKELPISALRKSREAVEIAQRRRDLHGCGAKKLRAVFKAATQSQSMPEIMAAYAEGLKGYFLRSAVDFDKADGGAAIAAALMSEQYELARRLISHGFRLKDAPASMQNELRLAGTAQAKKFAEEHLSGNMTIEPVEDVGRAKRAELRILATPFIGGARYGMF
ncbi:MAG: ankyrin repeat domain-containing protein [Alphaproteobacteria bacterium]